MKCRQVELAEVPGIEVRAEHFIISSEEIGEPGPGQVLIHPLRLGLNAGLARRLGGPATEYGPSVLVGDVPTSDAVVEVVRSEHQDYEPGDLALCTAAWRTVDVRDAIDLRPIGMKLGDTELEPYLTVLGHVGFTAYTGMIHIGEVASSDVVYVSAAAGGVGSCAVQFAKARGATVYGCAGSDEKVTTITDILGADAAVNRHDGSALDLLGEMAPDGIDLYFDNVGGDQLEAALDHLNRGGRIVLCGVASRARKPRGPANYRRMIYQGLTMRGFAVTQYGHLRNEFEETVSGWVDNGLVTSLHTTFHGFASIPLAFESLLVGAGTGRVIVADDG